MATTVVSRENINNWAPDSPNLYWFRRALEAMQEISDASLMDERGYQWVAGVHGGFGGIPYCEHGTLSFLTWHRPYILDFELKVRDQIRRLASAEIADEWRLPYWDWGASGVTGLPTSFTDQTYDDQGVTKPNPLYAMPYKLPYDPNVGQNPWPTTTFRSPRSVATLQSLRALVLDALENERQFNYFSGAIENPHNQLHNWVRGYMLTLRSSFDPIFWLHHCNVDRQFWLWQEKNGDSSIPASVRNFTCQPFAFQDNRAEAFFDTRTLGYTYAVSRTLVTADVARPAPAAPPVPAAPDPAAPAAAPPPAAAPLPDTLTVNVGSIDNDFVRARVHMHGVEHVGDTHEVHVFANRSTAPDDSTPKTDAEQFVGSYVILGHGECPGAPGHCERKHATRDGIRREHHLSPFDLFIDVSKGLSKLSQANSSGPGIGKLKLAFVVVNSVTGKQVSNDVIRFENISVTTHD